MDCINLLLLCLCLYCSQLGMGSAQENDNISLGQSDIENNIVDTNQQLQIEYHENHKPLFKDCARYSPEVKEEQAKDTFVIRVQAMEEDPPDKEGGRITYGIEEPPGTRVFFRIKSDTGEVFTNIPFDRDEPTRHKELYLTVRAVDDGRPQLADICTFKVTVTDINDNTPSFDQQEYSTGVSEDHPENMEVLRVFAYDSDDGENSRLTYSFANTGTNSNSLEDFFRIDQDTGVIYLKQKLTGKHGYKYSSTVVVQDNGEKPNKATADISFIVVDSDKKPPVIKVRDFEQTITLKEDANDFENALVTLTAESNINDKGVAFELVKGKTTQTNKDQTFILSPNGPSSAMITLARHLDYETVTEYQLKVRAQNKDSLYASVDIIVKVEDVNDEIPTFIELLKGSVVENDKIGAQAMTVRAIDKDGTSPNNVVVYELITHKELFDIDPDTGVITAKVEFDRETEKIYHVTVQARDSAPSALFRDKNKPNSANQTFQISIEDQNDNQPKFEKSLYVVYNISETSDKQKDVIEVKANDEDTASRISYSITEGNIDDAFYIEESTGRIKVNKQLDFEQIESYNLTVKAFDGMYSDETKVVIHISNENDERPQFGPYNKTVYFKEETVSPNCIIELTAYDPDIKDRSADQKIVYRVGDDYKSFLSVTSDGCVTLIKKLDRDPPKGVPSYQAYIHAYDNNGGPNSLINSAEISIVLEDINDNAPTLNITEVVWYENEPPGRILTLTATDNDSPINGPPFTFQIPDSASDIFDKFNIQGSDLYAQVVFDREEKKYYDVPVRITDSGTPQQSDISILRIIIGDRNDNAAQDGVSEIFVYKYEGFKMDTEIGRVYVDDPDDWDLPDKIFQPDGPLDESFDLHDGGMIVMKRDALPSLYKLKFVVTEQLMNGTRHQVHAEVAVTVKDIPEEAVRKSGSIRLRGVTIEQFIEKDPITQLSRKDILQNHISKILNTSVENVDVFTVLTSPSNNSFVDVRFSAHGSPYYEPEKLNNKATEEQSKLEEELGVEFVMININECLNDNTCPINSSCSNVLEIKDEPAVVFTNKTSFVGVKAVSEPTCECRKHLVSECFNGGTPIENGRCSCLEGFEGPNCENLGIGFTGDGWAMYPTFDSCVSSVISLNVLPQGDDGLIFYAGPLTRRQAALTKDFISVELKDGFVVLKLDLGSGADEVISDYKKINDGAMHKIKINFTMIDVQIEVDDCPSDCLRWKNLKKSGLLRINGPLQVGGRSDIFSAEESKIVWDNPPSAQGFRGCITNFTYNSYVYNLGSPSDKRNARGGTCNYATFQAATFGIDSNFLVAILVCLAILLILLLAVVVHKRKQDNFNEKDLDDTRENIINYEDEGGGECDTNFDLSVLRNVDDEKPPIKDNLYKQADVPADIGGFLDHKKRTSDQDILPYDDVRHYAYEGDGNSSGSLSSLASCTDEGDLKFNYLSNFGPRFRKLADMYGDDASEEASQNGEESWC